MKSNERKPHLIAVNETHLQRRQAHLNGYELISQLDRRDGRTHGGICLFALSNIAENISLLEHAPNLQHERDHGSYYIQILGQSYCASGIVLRRKERFNLSLPLKKNG